MAFKSPRTRILIWAWHANLASFSIRSLFCQISVESQCHRNNLAGNQSKEVLCRPLKSCKWNNQNFHLSKDVGRECDSYVDEFSKLKESELADKVNVEESVWCKYTEDLVNSLNFPTENKCPIEFDTSKRLEMNSKDVLLKRKTGRPVFRSIIYNCGELDASDLSMPPSPANPHPFVPMEHAPPVYTRSLVPLVNHSVLLQNLVDIGVNLFEVEQNTSAGKHLLRLEFRKDVKPKLQWLLSLGFDVTDLGVYLTKNPFYLLQDLKDMQARVNYLTAMRFSKGDVCKIIKDFRYWLNIDVKIIDSRLGWVQKQFGLTGDEVRDLIRKEARILMFGLGPLQRLVGLLNKEFGFSPGQIKRILLNDPRIFMMDTKLIRMNYDYVHNVMKISNSVIATYPLILRCSHSSIRNRHEFLKKLGKAVYEGTIIDGTQVSCAPIDNVKPVSMEVFLDGNDAVFARKAADTYVAVYNRFLQNN
ncbi:hypothetical protein DICVIV_10535 [Dictyocaulus viviparus]|uniref:mTERF n=1 Tax=Dictyocaulus viviparus TaxID=29172 RepID=A0A0D8XFJ9_DICVI|nr:hypothetical protein DICVIV_10535 [Dictyocaulus viviparus]